MHAGVFLREKQVLGTILIPFLYPLNTAAPPEHIMHLGDRYNVKLAVTAPLALSTEKSHIVQSLTRSWPAIWKWVKRLHSHFTLGFNGNKND